MIAFAASVVSDERWRRWALPGIERVVEPDSVVIDERGRGSLQSRLNRAIAAVSDRSDLEALVLLHEDVEIADPDFVAKVRRRLEDPSIAIVGPIGARHVNSIAWWDGEGFGRVDAPFLTATSWRPAELSAGFHEVDVVDGLLMVMSPWAARELRFDEELSDFHGYDSDICFQALARGRRVVVDDLHVIHYARGGIGDRDAWVRANLAFRRKWAARGARELVRRR